MSRFGALPPLVGARRSFGASPRHRLKGCCLRRTWQKQPGAAASHAAAQHARRLARRCIEATWPAARTAPLVTRRTVPGARSWMGGTAPRASAACRPSSRCTRSLGSAAAALLCRLRVLDAAAGAATALRGISTARRAARGALSALARRRSALGQCRALACGRRMPAAQPGRRVSARATAPAGPTAALTPRRGVPRRTCGRDGALCPSAGCSSAGARWCRFVDAGAAATLRRGWHAGCSVDGVGAQAGGVAARARRGCCASLSRMRRRRAALAADGAAPLLRRRGPTLHRARHPPRRPRTCLRTCPGTRLAEEAPARGGPAWPCPLIANSAASPAAVRAAPPLAGALLVLGARLRARSDQVRSPRVRGAERAGSCAAARRRSLCARGAPAARSPTAARARVWRLARPAGWRLGASAACARVVEAASRTRG